MMNEDKEIEEALEDLKIQTENLKEMYYKLEQTVSSIVDHIKGSSA